MNGQWDFEVVIRYPDGRVESVYTHRLEWMADLEVEVARERGMHAEKRDLRLTEKR